MTSVSEVVVYVEGLMACSACAPVKLTREEVAAAVNVVNPTGVSSEWKVSSDTTFHTGHPMPSPCEREPETRRHWLLEC